MILYYAVGGGLGHLTRARAVAHTLGLQEQVVLMTASPFARDRRVTGNFELVTVPMEVAGDMPAYRVWLQRVLARFQPSAIYLDTFPAGILGEFCDFSFPTDTPVHHVARLLQWDEYASQMTGTPPPLATTYVVEELTDEHDAFLRWNSAALSRLELRDPPQPHDDALKWIMRSLTGDGRPLWLVVHSGPASEIEELIAFAEEMRAAEGVEPRVLLVAPSRPSGLPERIAYLDLYPADAIFSYADRIITACGFNLMRQSEPYREKHRFMPFVRRFDDQFLRAARRRRSL